MGLPSCNVSQLFPTLLSFLFWENVQLPAYRNLFVAFSQIKNSLAYMRKVHGEGP